MSIPATYNWDNETRGDSFPARTFGPILVDDVELDLSDVEIRMQIRSSGNELLKEMEKGYGIVLSGTDKFTVQSFIIKTYQGKAYYDIEFTLSDGKVKTWIAGEFTVIKDITI